MEAPFCLQTSFTRHEKDTTKGTTITKGTTQGQLYDTPRHRGTESRPGNNAAVLVERVATAGKPADRAREYSRHSATRIWNGLLFATAITSDGIV